MRATRRAQAPRGPAADTWRTRGLLFVAASTTPIMVIGSSAAAVVVAVDDDALWRASPSPHRSRYVWARTPISPVPAETAQSNGKVITDLMTGRLAVILPSAICARTDRSKAARINRDIVTHRSAKNFFRHEERLNRFCRRCNPAESAKVPSSWT